MADETCRHTSWVGLPESGEIIYPEQEGLTGTQVRCTDGCNQVFESTDDILRAKGVDVPYPEELECLDRHEGGCSGKVELREPLSASGKSFPRCASHWRKRLDRQEDINRRYPDSDMPPKWFDPLAAGEHWNDDY